MAVWEGEGRVGGLDCYSSSILWYFGLVTTKDAHTHVEYYSSPSPVLVDNYTTTAWGLNILILRTLTSKLCMYCIKGVFICQCHTNTYPVIPNFSNKGLGETQTRGIQVLSPIGSQDENTVPMLDHMHRETFCEGL